MSRTQFLLHVKALELMQIVIVAAEQAALKFVARLVQPIICVVMKDVILMLAIVSIQIADALHAAELRIRLAAESKEIGMRHKSY
jgi:hypothetical protein